MNSAAARLTKQLGESNPHTATRHCQSRFCLLTVLLKVSNRPHLPGLSSSLFLTTIPAQHHDHSVVFYFLQDVHLRLLSDRCRSNCKSPKEGKTDCMDHRQWASVARAAVTTKQSNEVPRFKYLQKQKQHDSQVQPYAKFPGSTIREIPRFNHTAVKQNSQVQPYILNQCLRGGRL